MKKLLLLSALPLITANLRAQHPFKYDSLYRTIYAAQLCDFKTAHPNAVFIDVRTPGEYSDTSQFASLNLGHLSGAINIGSDTLLKNIHLLDPYRNNTIVLYCSHSQRSRRVSKLAAENGFTDFYSLNGGMSSLQRLNDKAFPCKKEMIVTGLPYRKVFAEEAAGLLSGATPPFVIDLRPPAMFNSIDTLQRNNVGHIRRSVNSDLAGLENAVAAQPKSRMILLIPPYQYSEAAKAAASLSGFGYSNVLVLGSGIDELISGGGNSSFMEMVPPYKIVDAEQTLHLLRSHKDLTIYDTRSLEEFENRFALSYKNLGRLAGATHADPASLPALLSKTDKTQPILIYGNEESYAAAKALSDAGFTHINVLSSLYDFVWSAFNLAANRGALQYLSNHEGLY